jgi:hypothetical protein
VDATHSCSGKYFLLLNGEENNFRENIYLSKNIDERSQIWETKLKKRNESESAIEQEFN